MSTDSCIEIWPNGPKVLDSNSAAQAFPSETVLPKKLTVRLRDTAAAAFKVGKDRAAHAMEVHASIVLCDKR